MRLPKKVKVRDVLKIINQRMVRYANTPLDQRRNAFDELYELSKELDEKYGPI